jgi:hypothetical protein
MSALGSKTDMPQTSSLAAIDPKADMSLAGLVRLICLPRSILLLIGQVNPSLCYLRKPRFVVWIRSFLRQL